MSDVLEGLHLVETLLELDANLKELDFVRNTKAKSYSQYVKLIQDGICFLPYITGRELAFAPSKYLGYAPNNLHKNTVKTDRSGTVSNDTLDTLLGDVAEFHAGLEEDYLAFCLAVGGKPRPTGSFGKPRKYWRVYRSARPGVFG